ncbi:MBL fold metallo-hydrolase [Aeromicrobium sp. IC_218]|uniref:MBL fold metallo-hydrolase n=1 Tax=Aeromicrobium sp. IC_218 TaxID=2545468 RepID=UPI00103CE41B|nr:MBL fold metallo-hydrolase [Aeromicrobium sp. IC_218]TCI96320.1 MBL fold metallo-hydrolase [Aeromicrobium sp. IC_218]
MRLTRHGHACLLVETGGAHVLVDPGVFSPDAAFALEGLDAVVVTHQHPDHVDDDRLPGLLALNPDAVLLAEPQVQEKLGDAWTPTAHGRSVTVRGATLTGVGELHAVIAAQLPRVGNVGVLVSAPGEPTLFHPGDSYAVAPEDVDVLALPLSAPWTKVSETIDFLQRVAPRTYLPVHDATIAPPAYDIYWNHTATLGGVADARRLAPDESTQV